MSASFYANGGKFWTDFEVAIMREMWPDHTQVEIAARLGRAPDSVRKKSWAIGLRPKNPSPRHTVRRPKQKVIEPQPPEPVCTYAGSSEMGIEPVEWTVCTGAMGINEPIMVGISLARVRFLEGMPV